VDWSHTVDYQSLLKVPEVRDRIARSGVGVHRRLSGERFLELCDLALKPFADGLPLATLAQCAQPLYAKLGVKTGKERRENFSRPAGLVLVDVLCSLSAHDRPVNKVHQLTDGCLIEATLPSDIFSFEGELHVAVQREASQTGVEARTLIKGQRYDWGKSRRSLDELFADLHAGRNAA
jgi:hypothetical protein